MRTTDVLCGTCTCGHNFEVPTSSQGTPHSCPVCGAVWVLDWPKYPSLDPEPEPVTISEQEGLP